MRESETKSAAPSGRGSSETDRVRSVPPHPSRGGEPAMGTADATPGDPGRSRLSGDSAPAARPTLFASPSAALRAASAALDYVHGCAAELDGAACGDLLVALGQAQ